jgi:hypothetical protein
MSTLKAIGGMLWFGYELFPQKIHVLVVFYLEGFGYCRRWGYKEDVAHWVHISGIQSYSSPFQSLYFLCDMR